MPENKKSAVEPPKTLTVRFCPTCGHDDTTYTLKDRHFANGKLCKGKPVEIIYCRAA